MKLKERVKGKVEEEVKGKSTRKDVRICSRMR